MSKTFYYVSACAGSGKTTTALHSIVKGVQHGSKFVVAQPTKQLVENTIDNFINKVRLHGLKYKVITSDHFNGTTHSEFTNSIKSADVDVIFTTHATLLACSQIANKSAWNLIVDEIPNVVVPFYANLSLTWDDWLSNVLTEEADDTDALILSPKPGSSAKIEEWAFNEKGDDVITVTQRFWDMLVNPHYRLEVTKADWQTAGYNGDANLNAHGTMLPSIFYGWDRVTVMGANFENSIMNIAWSSMGVEFEPDPAIAVESPFHSVEVGARARIHYFTEKDWSKYLRDKISFDRIARHLLPFIDGPHIWSANNDIRDGQWKAPQATKLAPISHGLNSYVNYDKAVFLAALNDKPVHGKWLENRYGIQRDELAKAKSLEAAYQMVMRTNLRDPNGTKPVDIFVADRRTADFLCSLLPGSKQHFIDLGIMELGKSQRERPTKVTALSAAERTKISQAKKRRYLKQIDALSQSLMQRQNVMRISEIQPSLTLESSIDATQTVTQSFGSFDQMHDLLKEMYELSYRHKADNMLITGATFSKGETSETHKGLDAFVMTQVMQLDFDDSELDPKHAKLLFEDFKHVAYNSMNNGRDNLHRYRVFIPLARPVGEETYKALWDLLAQRVVDAGFQIDRKVPGKQSGLDLSKRTPVSFMYAPCQAASKHKSFWIDNWQANIMDPTAFIKRITHETPEALEAAPLIIAVTL